MTTATLLVPAYLCEYVRALYSDFSDAGAVRFPPSSDLSQLLTSAMCRRRAGGVAVPPDMADFVSLPVVLPTAGGKRAETFCCLSADGQRRIVHRLRVMLWAELHGWLDDCLHRRGWSLQEGVRLFCLRWGITTLTEGALLKNYYRWRQRVRRFRAAGLPL